jgi:hypothetical protein
MVLDYEMAATWSMATDSVRPLEHQLRPLQSNPLCSHRQASTELTLLNRVSCRSHMFPSQPLTLSRVSKGALSGRFDEAKTVDKFQQNIFHKRYRRKISMRLHHFIQH